MTLYLIDYRQTLDTLPSPIGFISQLRAVDPECKIIIMSGGDVPDDVVQAADDFWIKVGSLMLPRVRKENPDRIVISDDQQAVMRTCARQFRVFCPVETVAPKDLMSLLKSY